MKNVIKASTTNVSNKVVDFSTAMPKNKGEMNKESMMFYVRTYGEQADQKWFARLLKDNQKEKKNNIQGGTYMSFDMGVVREQFCQHFEDFYHLSDKAKREARIDTYFATELDELFSLLDDEEEQDAENNIVPLASASGM